MNTDKYRYATYDTESEEEINQLMEPLTKAVLESAEENFDMINPEINRDYITDETWELIEERKTEPNSQRKSELTKRIRKAAKRDRKRYIIQSWKI